MTKTQPLPGPAAVPKTPFSKWHTLLPVPPPVMVGVLCGAAGGARLGFLKFLLLLVLASALTPVLYRYCMSAMGRQLKSYIEKVDRNYIGVDVHIESIDFSVFYGRCIIHGLVVDNPEGYKSDYLLKANRLTIDLDVQRLILSMARHIVVEELELHEIDSIIEYDSILWGSAFGTSNLQKVIGFMNKNEKKDGDGKASDKKESADKKPKAEGAQPGRKWTMQKVAFTDVGAKMATKLTGTRIACADVRYKNYDEEVGSSGITDVILTLLKTICKSVLVNVTGKSFGEKLM